MKTNSRTSDDRSQNRAASKDDAPWHRKLQAAIASGYATRIAPAAEMLFEEGGKKLAPRAVKEFVQNVAKETAPEVLEAGTSAVKVAARSPGATVAASAKVIATNTAKSSAWGAAIDLGVSGYTAVRQGMTAKDAMIFVAKETGKGGIASAVGTVAAAGVIAIAGPIAPLAVLGVSFAATLGTRAALDAIDTRQVVIGAADAPTSSDRVSEETPSLS